MSHDRHQFLRALEPRTADINFWNQSVEQEHFNTVKSKKGNGGREDQHHPHPQAKAKGQEDRAQEEKEEIQ